jgi:Bacterial protein of unknown function (DUF885)
MTQILRLCADYIDQLAVLDPVHASVLGIGAEYGAATDYSPEGHAARADLVRATLAALGRLPVTSEADRQAANHLRERLQAEEAWHASGEPLRLLRAPWGVVSRLRDSVELLPRGDDEQWRGVAARLAAVPGTLASWRVGEATALLGQTQYVVGHDAYRGWLQDRHDQAIEELHGTHFDIAAPLRVVEVTLEPDSTSGSAYYTPPSEDLTRPGRTWWPIGGRKWSSTSASTSTCHCLTAPGGPSQQPASSWASAAAPNRISFTPRWFATAVVWPLGLAGGPDHRCRAATL